MNRSMAHNPPSRGWAPPVPPHAKTAVFKIPIAPAIASPASQDKVAKWTLSIVVLDSVAPRVFLAFVPQDTLANSVKTPSPSAMSQCVRLLLQLSGLSYHGIFPQTRPLRLLPVLASSCSQKPFQA